MGAVDGVNSPAPTRARWLRLGLIVAFVLGCAVVGAMYVDTDVWTPEYVRALGERGGVWGALMLIGVWCVVNFVQVPSAVFAFAALGLYGPWVGGFVAWSGALVVLSVVFAVTRLVGGTALQGSQRPWLRRALQHLDAHPVATLALARAVCWLSPAVNYPVVLAGIRYRDYLLGSALGLAVPVLILSSVWALGWDGQLR